MVLNNLLEMLPMAAMIMGAKGAYYVGSAPTQ